MTAPNSRPGVKVDDALLGELERTAEMMAGRDHPNTARLLRRAAARIAALAAAAEHEERDLGEVMAARDAHEETLAAIYEAAGGDREDAWVGKLPPEEPPHSGHAGADALALVQALAVERARQAVMLSKVVRFYLPHDAGGKLFVERRGDLWCVSDGLNVLCADGSWEWEPQPSSRTEEFKARTRFTCEEALAKAEAFQSTLSRLSPEVQGG